MEGDGINFFFFQILIRGVGRVGDEVKQRVLR